MYIKLVEVLEQLQIPYSQLAKKIGMPISTMFDKYHGNTAFTLEEAEDIKAALGVTMTIEELFKKSKEGRNDR